MHCCCHPHAAIQECIVRLGQIRHSRNHSRNKGPRYACLWVWVIFVRDIILSQWVCMFSFLLFSFGKCSSVNRITCSHMHTQARKCGRTRLTCLCWLVRRFSSFPRPMKPRMNMTSPWTTTCCCSQPDSLLPQITCVWNCWNPCVFWFHVSYVYRWSVAQQSQSHVWCMRCDIIRHTLVPSFILLWLVFCSSGKWFHLSPLLAYLRQFSHFSHPRAAKSWKAFLDLWRCARLWRCLRIWRITYSRVRLHFNQFNWLNRSIDHDFCLVIASNFSIGLIGCLLSYSCARYVLDGCQDQRLISLKDSINSRTTGGQVWVSACICNPAVLCTDLCGVCSTNRIDAVSPYIPESDHKLITHIRRMNERKERKAQHALEASQSNQGKHVRAAAFTHRHLQLMVDVYVCCTAP